MDTVELSRALSPSLSLDAFPIFLPRAPWWGGDLQTLRNFLIGRAPRLAQSRSQRLELPLGDGSGDRLLGMLDLPLAKPAVARPLVVLIHGLSGTEESFYVLKTAEHLLGCGHAVLRLNLRGAGPSRPLCRFQYHAGRSEDLAVALAGLPAPLTAAGVVAVGYSLGANMLLKFLGEGGHAVPLRAAAAVSAPLDLAGSARQMMRRRNAVYQRRLLRDMRRESLGPGAEVTAAERAAIRSARSIWEFDDRFSAPRNGFTDAEDYYARNAALRFLDGIAVPTLVIHALDDPWIPAAPYLAYEWRRNPNLLPLLPARGGHVGFHSSDRRGPWHDLCLGQFLAAF